MPAREDFEELYHDAPVGYFTTQIDDVIARVNRTFLTWTGYRESDVLGRHFADLLHPDDRRFYQSRRVPVLRLHGEVREVGLRVLRADGAVLPVLLNSVVVLSEDETPRLIRGVIFDATGRTEYEAELLAQRRLAEAAAARVQVLQNASVRFAESSTESELAEALNEIVADALVAEVSCVATVDDTGELDVIAGVNPLAGRYALTDARPGPDSLTRGRTLVFASADDLRAEYPVIAEAMRDAGLEGIASFPLLRDRAPFGIVAAFFAERTELEPVAIELVEAIARQAAQTLARIRLQEEIAHLALHDQLTGLANRVLLRDLIDRAIAAGTEAARPVAMMFLDLDGFKPVNDRLGHPVGDDVLREVARRLGTVIRDTDVVGRFGGDEFLVLCPDTDDEHAAVIAERIRQAVAEPIEWLAPEFTISASVGVVVHRPSRIPATPDELLELADAEMYRAKGAGRNRVSLLAR